MASALKLIVLLAVSSVFTGCYAPNVVEVSTKLSTQCGLSLKAPNCVDPGDTEVMDRLWERFVMAEVTSSEVEDCLLAMECDGSSASSDLDSSASSNAALNACVQEEAVNPNPVCMWNCLSAFMECTPAAGSLCDADFVEDCLDTREACEHRC